MNGTSDFQMKKQDLNGGFIIQIRFIGRSEKNHVSSIKYETLLTLYYTLQNSRVKARLLFKKVADSLCYAPLIYILCKFIICVHLIYIQLNILFTTFLFFFFF